MNFIGKTLVVFNMAFCGFLLFLSVAIYTNSVDFGWQEPRKELSGFRVPSEIDKRTIAVETVNKEVSPVVRRLEVAQQNLHMAHYKWARAHLKMKEELQKLQTGQGNIARQKVNVNKGLQVEVLEDNTATALKNILLENGKIKLQKFKFPFKTKVLKKDGTIENRTVQRDYTGATPLFEQDVMVSFSQLDPITKNVVTKTVPLDRSYNTYLRDLQKLKVSIDTVKYKIREWNAEQQRISVLLNGGEVMFPTWWIVINGNNNALSRLVGLPEVLTYAAYQPVDSPQVPGLYNLYLEREIRIQEKLQREIDHIKPQWVRVLINSQLHINRQQTLEYRLKELRKKIEEKKAALAK